MSLNFPRFLQTNERKCLSRQQFLFLHSPKSQPLVVGTHKPDKTMYHGNSAVTTYS